MTDGTERFVRNAGLAFENAIDKGRLIATKKPGWSEFNWVCNFMYMYSNNTHDFFKHIDTRKYIEVLR